MVTSVGVGQACTACTLLGSGWIPLSEKNMSQIRHFISTNTALFPPRLILPSEDVKELDRGDPCEIRHLGNKPKFHPDMLKQMEALAIPSPLVIGSELVLLSIQTACNKIGRGPCLA